MILDLHLWPGVKFGSLRGWSTADSVDGSDIHATVV
jgi:hypothetical protein